MHLFPLIFLSMMADVVCVPTAKTGLIEPCSIVLPVVIGIHDHILDKAVCIRSGSIDVMM
jgi:hypothetical protein